MATGKETDTWRGDNYKQIYLSIYSVRTKAKPVQNFIRLTTDLINPRYLYRIHLHLHSGL